MNQRLGELDALRGLAALSVILYHYTTRYEGLFDHKNPSYFDFSYGFLGVQLFFMISGFVIFMTITRAKNVSEFAKKRAIRLYPSYIVAVIITFVSVKAYGLEGREVSFFEGILNLTMFQGFLPGVINNVDGVYWSLAVELIFYIFIGILLYLGLIKRIETMAVIWLIGSATARILNILFEQHLITKALVYYSVADYSHLFIAGIMFYLIKNNAQTKHYLILTSCLIYQFIFNELVPNIVVTAFFAIFYALIKGKLGFLNVKLLTYLGAISFTLYLVHQNIGYIIINIMENSGLTNKVFLIIPVAISIGIAHILTYYVEKPSLKFFRNHMNESKNKKEIKTIA